jgi:hypothetical protein
MVATCVNLMATWEALSRFDARYHYYLTQIDLSPKYTRCWTRKRRTSIPCLRRHRGLYRITLLCQFFGRARIKVS